MTTYGGGGDAGAGPQDRQDEATTFKERVLSYVAYDDAIRTMRKATSERKRAMAVIAPLIRDFMRANDVEEVNLSGAGKNGKVRLSKDKTKLRRSFPRRGDRSIDL